MVPMGPSEPNFDWNGVCVIHVRNGGGHLRHDRQIYQTQGTSERRRRIIGQMALDGMVLFCYCHSQYVILRGWTFVE